MRLILVLLLVLSGCTKEDNSSKEKTNTDSSTVVKKEQVAEKKEEKKSTQEAKKAETETVSHTFLSPFGNFDDIYKNTDNHFPHYLYKNKAFPYELKLPNGKSIKAKPSQVLVHTDFQIIVSSSINVYEITDLKAIEAFISENSFLKEEWDKKAADWIKEGGKKNLRVEFKFETFEIVLDISFRESTWSYECNVKALREKARPIIIAHANKNGIHPPDKTITAVFENMMRGSAISPNGKEIIITDKDGADFYDIATAKKTKSIPGVMGRLSLSSDKKLLAAKRDREFKIFDIASGKETLKLEGNVQVFPDFKKAFLSDDKSKSVIELPSGKKLLELEGASNQNSCLFFYPDMKKVLFTSRFKDFVAYDLESGKEISPLEKSRDFFHMSSIKEGKELVAGGHMTGSKVRFWDTETLKTTREFKAFTSNTLSVSPDEKIIVTADWSSFYVQNIYLYDMEGKLLGIAGPLPDSPARIHFTADNKYMVAVMAHSKKIHIWELDKIISK